MKKTIASITALALLAGAVFLVGLLVRPRRRRMVPPVPVDATAASAPIAVIPVSQWTRQFVAMRQAGRWDELASELVAIRARSPELFQRYSLGFLLGRAQIEIDALDDAEISLRPFLAEGNAFRDLALRYSALIADEEGDVDRASELRRQLIADYPDAPDRNEAIDEELAVIAGSGDTSALTHFAQSLGNQVDPARAREIDAMLVELLLDNGRSEEAVGRALAVLKNGITDDAAERVGAALERSNLIDGLSAPDRKLLARSQQAHRHFEEAVELYRGVLGAFPKDRDEILFAIGRSQFGSEEYEAAERTYLEGARSSASPQQQATFLYHASRAAQLQGEDQRAEVEMTRAIAVPGRFPATSASLTQRLRTRLKAGRLDDARHDLVLLRQLFPGDHGVVEASIATAMALVASGREAMALDVLKNIPPRAMDRYDPSEIEYWRARALERASPDDAVEAYLRVLRAAVPTHFSYFARHRLRAEELAEPVAAAIGKKTEEAARHLEEDDLAGAREAQTDLVFLAGRGSRAVQLGRLREIYLQSPRYREVLELSPESLPSFPLPESASRGQLLMAMGLLGDAIDFAAGEYSLTPMKEALTRSLVMNRGGASRESIRSVEILMRSVPDDFVPELLPSLVQELLYPRYFLPLIEKESARFDADPLLVLSIMREESRFNPRAKSMAAARGLLQFIITTARDVGRRLGLIDLTSEDLYDPRTIIELGAKYVGELSDELGADPYQIAAAYNAGPNQVRLWARLAPGAGDDYFLSSVNFDETKHYVRKVLNSRERYDMIYGNREPVGGMRVEP